MLLSYLANSPPKVSVSILLTLRSNLRALARFGSAGVHCLLELFDLSEQKLLTVDSTFRNAAYDKHPFELMKRVFFPSMIAVSVFCSSAAPAVDYKDG